MAWSGKSTSIFSISGVLFVWGYKWVSPFKYPLNAYILILSENAFSSIFMPGGGIFGEKKGENARFYRCGRLELLPNSRGGD